jgi:hypothetical protein
MGILKDFPTVTQQTELYPLEEDVKLLKLSVNPHNFKLPAQNPF